MQIKDAVAVVTGGASGLGLATTKRAARRGAHRSSSIDLKGEDVVAELGDRGASSSRPTSPTRRPSAKALDVAEALGPLRINVNCAGIGNAIKTLGKDGPFPLDRFTQVVRST